MHNNGTHTCRQFSHRYQKMEGYGKLGRIKKVEQLFLIERPNHILLTKKGSMEEATNISKIDLQAHTFAPK